MFNGRKYLIGMVAAVNVLSIFAAGNVMAEVADKRPNYGQAKLGVFQPTGDLDDAGFDTGGEFGGTYGRYLTPFLVAEASFDIFATENDFRSSNDLAGSYKQEDTIAAAAFLVTIKGEVPIGPVSLFGGIGGGVYSVSLDSEIDSSRLGDFDADDSDTVLGAHLVAGVNYDITDRFFVGMEGMYRWTDDVDLSETVATVPIEYSGDLSGFSITATGGFRF
jgi:opacity protein-like surface antigen